MVTTALVPSLKIAPPASEALLPEKVELVIVTAPLLSIAPPSAAAVLLANVLLRTVKAPKLKIAPPSFAALPENVQFVTPSVPTFSTAPPSPVLLVPLASVRSLRSRVAPNFTNKISLALPPSITTF